MAYTRHFNKLVFMVVAFSVITDSFGQDLRFKIASSSTAESPLLIASHQSSELTWAVGAASSVVRIFDGESSTITCPYDSLQLRDVHGFGSDHALILSIGEGADSKVLQWKKGHWTILYTLADTSGFLDCMDFWDDQRGIIYGDSFDGWPYILLTSDGGLNWIRVDSTALPRAGAGEGGFASSGTCVQSGTHGVAWIGSGAGGNARLLVTQDYGKTWQAMSTPMIKGQAAGITSLDFVDPYNGVIVGGDLAKMNEYTPNAFRTSDGGQTWQALQQPMTTGPLYCVAYEQISGNDVIVISGPNGADGSLDGGQTWQNLAHEDLWRCELGEDGEGWLMGRDGMIYSLSVDFTSE